MQPMQLTTSSLHPYLFMIDDKQYTAEKLTLGDLNALSEGLAKIERDAVQEEYSPLLVAETDSAKRLALDKERIEHYNAITPRSPGEMLGWLLTNARGQVMLIYTALRKKHPEVSVQQISDLIWNDDLVQVCYDLLDIKRRLVTVTEEAKAPADPPHLHSLTNSAPSGDSTKPNSLTSTPASTGETSP